MEELKTADLLVITGYGLSVDDQAEIVKQENAESGVRLFCRYGD